MGFIPIVVTVVGVGAAATVAVPPETVMVSQDPVKRLIVPA